jgi:hypothetical protein
MAAPNVAKGTVKAVVAAGCTVWTDDGKKYGPGQAVELLQADYVRMKTRGHVKDPGEALQPAPPGPGPSVDRDATATKGK